MRNEPVTGARKYQLRFATGRVATFLDPDREPPADMTRALFDWFGAGYLLEVIEL